MNDDNKSLADAEAEDYNEIVSDENICKYSIWCHIVAAILLSAIVVGVATLGILSFT